MSRVRTGKDVITVEIIFHCLLRWLSGGSYLDIRLSAGISKVAFHNYIYKCMDAILDSKALAYKFTSNTKELDEAAQGFESLRSQAEIKGVLHAYMDICFRIKSLQVLRQAMSRHIFQGIIKHME